MDYTRAFLCDDILNETKSWKGLFRDHLFSHN